MELKILIAISICTLLGLSACEFDQKSASDGQPNPKEEEIDSVSKWFSNTENFSDKNYLPLFYKNFNERMKAKKWNDAATLMSKVGYVVYFNSKTDSTLIKTHIDFIEKHENDITNDIKCAIYLNIGVLYYYNSNMEELIKYLNKAIDIPSDDHATQLNKQMAYKELSYGYSDLGKYDKALDASFKALEIAENLKDTIGIGATYDTIADVYDMMYDYENAEIYYNKAIKTLASVKYNIGVLSVYLNKIMLYEIYDKNKMYPMIDTMYQFFNQNKFSYDAYELYAKSWFCYKLLNENKLVEAGKLLEEVRPIFEASNEKFLYTAFFSAAAQYEKETGEDIIKNTVYEAFIPYFKKNKNYGVLMFTYDVLKEDAIAKNDYKAAYNYSQKYNEVADSLFDKSLILKTKELDRKYQTEKKEIEIKIQKKEIQSKNNSILLLISSLIGLLLATVAFYLWQRQKTLNQEKNNSRKFTKQLLESTESERRRIASDLHDSISHELLTLKSVFQQDIGIVNSKIDSIIDDVRSISRNLHPVMFDKIGLVPNIMQFVERLQNQSDFLVSTDINYDNSLTSSDELQLYRIIQEALTNIIKYANAHAAKITIAENAEEMLLEIRDNGCGFDVKQVLNGGKAFGLHNIIERSRAIGGEASIKSSAKGTIIKISIPKKKL